MFLSRRQFLKVSVGTVAAVAVADKVLALTALQPRDFEREYRASRDVDFTRQLYPGLQTFDAWLARNKGAIPVGQVAGAS